jgi:hypothetical protein
MSSVSKAPPPQVTRDIRLSQRVLMADTARIIPPMAIQCIDGKPDSDRVCLFNQFPRPSFASVLQSRFRLPLQVGTPLYDKLDTI